MKPFVYTVRGLSEQEKAPVVKQLIEGIEGVISAEVQVADADREGCVILQYRERMSADERMALENILAETLNREAGVELQLPALADRYVAGTAPKPGRQVGLGAAIASVITAVIIAVLLTFAICTVYKDADTPDTAAPGQGTTEDRFAELDTIDRLFRSLTNRELDDEALITAVLKAYVSATGDAYAEYFTAEEFAAQTDEQNGKMCGVGIGVVNDLLTVDGVAYQAIIVANVYPDSPAEAAGVLPGDAIMFLGSGEDRVLVNSVGYTEALNRLRGEKGSYAEFSVYRKPTGAEEDADFEIVDFSIQRDEIVTRSVIYDVCDDTDGKVGMVRVTAFDNTTAAQFSEAMDELLEQGCTHIVFDMRNNPGGLLTSVVDVLTYFLEDGDLVISTKDKNGKEDKIYVSSQTDANGKLTMGSGTLTPNDIGKYRGLSFAVLVNKYTASAAELFTANFRDHELGSVVGVTTFGKGSMQTTYSLAYYGYDGALKLTTRYYFPPSGEGYDGIGIVPDVEVALSEEALRYNINLLPDSLDDQLQAAIRTFGD